MRKMTVRDMDVAGKRVLVRVDFNVPFAADGTVADDTRIRASLPTILYLLERGAKVILASHLGRPDGQVVEGLRMQPVAERLRVLLGRAVLTVDECVGPKVDEAVANLRRGEVLMLENVRFHPEEEKNAPQFAQKLARLADIFVNDAFGTAHRAHASTAGVAAYLPAVAGLLMEKEVAALSRALEAPARPFVALIGGAKVSTKLAVLHNLLGRVDRLLIGGGMACTFLKAQGLEVGQSLVEEDRIGEAGQLIAQAGDKLLLPLDAVVAERVDVHAPTQTVDIGAVPPGWAIVDIGPRTVEAFRQVLGGAGTVLWNGPMGIFEIRPFAQGTAAVAEALAQVKGTTIVGGGDLVAAVEGLGYAHRMTLVSTGGGATLEFLEGRTMPGVAVLNEKEG